MKQLLQGVVVTSVTSDKRVTDSYVRCFGNKLPKIAHEAGVGWVNDSTDRSAWPLVRACCGRLASRVGYTPFSFVTIYFSKPVNISKYMT